MNASDTARKAANVLTWLLIAFFLIACGVAWSNHLHSDGWFKFLSLGGLFLLGTKIFSFWRWIGAAMVDARLMARHIGSELYDESGDMTAEEILEFARNAYEEATRKLYESFDSLLFRRI